jgi:hypothetical protein
VKRARTVSCHGLDDGITPRRHTIKAKQAVTPKKQGRRKSLGLILAAFKTPDPQRARAVQEVHSTAQHPTVHAQNCLLFAIKTRQQQIERLYQPINQSEGAITLFTPGHTFYTAASERSVRSKSPAVVTTTQTHCCTTSKLVCVVGGSTGFLQAAEELYI